MVPAQELATHAPLPTLATLTLIRNLSAEWMGNEFAPVPQGKTLAVVFPL
jgi:hypothetical protein